MTVRAYLRVSRQDQADSGAGMAAQRVAIEREAASRGWDDVEWYEDGGESGKDLDRPSMERLLADVRRGDVVVAAKVDRISRSLVDFASLIEEFQKRGWSIITLDLGLDLSTPQGEFVASILAAFARVERRIIGDRTRDAMQAKKAAGTRFGRKSLLPLWVQERVEVERAESRTLTAIAEGPQPRWSGDGVRRAVASVVGAVSHPVAGETDSLACCQRAVWHDRDQRTLDCVDGRLFEGARRESSPEEIAEAIRFLADRPLVILGGAGLSTDSGIPDYRGPGAPVRMPMTYQEFVSGPAAQQRYWARSHLGWSRMRRAEPNAGHRAVAALGAALVITQNVDGLHEAAGTPRTVALHGRIADVVCLACRRTTPRAALQQRLESANPGWAARHADVAVRPDGDVDLEDTAGFVVPGCEACGGTLKPDVVFFGENVPKPRVERCYAAVEALGEAGCLLVAGSSLTVMSGLRFVRRAAQRGSAVVIVNRGPTRGDDLASYKVEAGTSEWLGALAGARVGGDSPRGGGESAAIHHGM